MNFTEYINSLENSLPAPSLSIYLQALWYDGKNEWEQSHNLIQDVEDATAAHIHAYLHRKEGDRFNADYWYRRAGKKRPTYSLEEEWEALVKSLL